MADTMKFGPEWLRALSDGNSVTSPPPSPAPGLGTKYKLAEHRYGREEMLALFVPNTKIPDEVKETPSICVEKCQHPLAFVQPCDEEQRLLSQSVNSSVVLRMMGQGRGGPMSRGGRGGLSERGRGMGRGRGRGEGYYQRGSFDEDGYGRGRARGDVWDDGRDKRFERGFPSRPGFDDAQTSPRRELSRSMSSDNWRDTKKDDDDDGDWRRAGPKERWGSRNTWRDQLRGGFDQDFHGRFNDYSRDRERRPFDQERPSVRSRSRSTGSWEDEGDPDALPEWSTADDDVGNLGTFDSSGAFMSLKECEGEALEEEHEAPGKKSKEKKLPRSKDESRQNGEAMETEKGASRKPSPPPTKASKDVPKTDAPSSHPVQAGKGAATVEKPVGKHPMESVAKSKQREDSDIGTKTIPASVGGQSAAPTAPSPTGAKSVDSTSATVNAQGVGRDTFSDASASAQNGASGRTPVQKGTTIPKASVKTPSESATVTGPRQQRKDEEANFDHLEEAAENLVATWTAEEDAKSDSIAKVEQGAVPMDHEDAKKWFYKDPQGDLQGPFSAAEMSEWFSAGYFTMNLLVKRGCDESFQPLGELIKQCNRVPFLPGPPIPPLKSSPQGGSATTPSASTAAVLGSNPAADTLPEQYKVIQQQQQQQQQMLMHQQFLQQQALIRQLQLQQIMQTMQSQEAFSKLTPQQQQQLAVQLLLKQQASMMQLQQQQQGIPTAEGQQVLQAQQPQPAVVTSGAPTVGHTEQQQQIKLSPRSASGPEEVTSASAHFKRSLSQPGDNQPPAFHRSMSTPGGEQPQMWDSAAPGVPTPVSGAWVQSGSVWDIEPTKPQALDVQRIEMERIQREQEERDHEERCKEEERRREEEERLQQEIKRQKELEIQREIDIKKQQELERQEMERQREIQRELERQRENERQREIERQKVEQMRREQEEAERRMEEEKKRLEDEERERKRIEELQRLEEERKRKGSEDAMERKRQEEIRRRQEKEEQRRQLQQQEVLRRMQQEQMANMQLPASAHWGSGPPTTTSSGGPSLTQIQQMEAEKERKEQMEHQRKLELQRQQMVAMQQQQQQTARWTSAPRTTPQQGGTPSLLDIQQEQARQQQSDLHRQQHQHQHQAKAPMSLGTAAVWGGNTSSSHWATEGAWGSNPQNNSSLGFWDDAVSTSNKKTSVNNNAHFPSLTSSLPASSTSVSGNRTRQTKAKKEEESIQRLFTTAKPTDELTHWCESALRGLNTSVDIPTFVSFLIDVDSPYEVHEYVKSYLGDSDKCKDFACTFLEKREKHRNHLKQQQEEPFWNQVIMDAQSSNSQSAAEEEFRSVKGKKKNRMKKLDSSILGFTVHAAPDRIVGEIESTDPFGKM